VPTLDYPFSKNEFYGFLRKKKINNIEYYQEYFDAFFEHKFQFMMSNPNSRFTRWDDLMLLNKNDVEIMIPVINFLIKQDFQQGVDKSMMKTNANKCAKDINNKTKLQKGTLKTW
jgi:hypothetical protein